MELLRYLLLGMIQGFTEFLPVSSSGHLILAEHWLHLNPPGVVTEVSLHVATLSSVVIVYRRDIAHLWSEKNWRYLGLIILSTLVTAAIVWPLKGPLAALTEWDGAVRLVGCMLLLTAGWLIAADWHLQRRPQPQKLSWVGALLVGVAQATAALPGVSRSGATIGAAVQLGAQREAAARFSFLLSVPVIAGAGVVTAGELPSAVASGMLDPWGLALAFVAALGCGVLAIYAVLWLLRRARLVYFAAYCSIIAVAALVLG